MFKEQAIANTPLFVDDWQCCDDGCSILLKVSTSHSGEVLPEGKIRLLNDLPGSDLLFLGYLQNLVDRRKQEMPEGSYTSKLFSSGTRKIAQKVGEEAVETIIGAMANDDENFLYEGADLIYHLIVLLAHKGFRIEDLSAELRKRHK